MDDKDLRIELEARLSKLVKNLAGSAITQTLIDSIWAATYDEIKHLNYEVMNFSPAVIDWIHSQYVNRVIKISTSTGVMTIGDMTTQHDSPRIEAIALVDLYRLRKMFENTLLEGDIVSEINHRLNNHGKTDKQAPRGGVSTDN